MDKAKRKHLPQEKKRSYHLYSPFCNFFWYFLFVSHIWALQSCGKLYSPMCMIYLPMKTMLFEDKNLVLNFFGFSIVLNIMH